MSTDRLVVVHSAAAPATSCDPVVQAEFLAHALSELAHWRRSDDLIDELMAGCVMHGVWQRWAQQNGYDEAGEPDLDEIVEQVLAANEKRCNGAAADGAINLRLVASDGKRVS